LLLSPLSLAAQIRKKRINTMFLTTSVFNRVAADAPWAFQPVRNLLFGGEAADPKSVLAAFKAGRPERLLNVYGPTESTTFATWHLLEEPPDEAAGIPIGRPISNTQIYVLDHWLNPVPPGIAGQLYIGGDGLARCYHHRPDLTAERFIPNPFGDKFGERLYATGDLARYLSDGAIEYLGRADHQVKLRGFRIELGEIEAVLGMCSGVRQAVVLAREDVPGDKRLVAYVVKDQDGKLGVEELQRFLQTRLPDYMIPSAYVFADSLPLTPNRKVDRTALGPPGQQRPVLRQVYVEPGTETERRLAEVWREVLGLKQVGIHDSFFELGGHSLLATQLISRVREAFQVELQFAAFFQSATIAGMAKQIEAMSWAAQSRQASAGHQGDYEEGEL
jgi:acyl-CoA synthetase (AMP-forming)/AMP-acid ligase II/acyl carrier protein